MKRQLWKSLIYLGLLILVIVSPQFVTQASGDYDSVAAPAAFGEYEQIGRIADSEGSVRIIAELVIPNYEQLRSESNKYGTVIPGRSFPHRGIEADLALKEAIDLVVDSVISSLKGTTYTVNRTYSSLPFIALSLSPEALDILEKLPEVMNIIEDQPLKLITPVEGKNQLSKDGSTSPGDPNMPLLDNTVDIIGASDAWSMGYTGNGWYVAVLDTGIRSTHEFFAGKMIVEACYALGDDGFGPAGDCPNGQSEMTGPGSAVHHPDTYEGWDHGTHVAGIATGDSSSLYGVAPDAQIIAIQVFSKFTPADCGTPDPCVLTWNSDSLAGLDHVYSIRGTYSIASVNMSLGGGAYSAHCDSDMRKTAIDNLRAAGIATCIATGNDGYCGFVGSPACISSAVSVGSSTDADLESFFNNWHATLQELFAPGSSVYSSTGDSDNSYASWSGTSMATPHVAGAWALMKQASPSGAVSLFESALNSTGVGITSVCDGHTVPIPRIQVNDAIGTLPMPDMQVKVLWINLPDGSNTDVGTIKLKKIVKGPVAFTIRNIGGASLLLTGAPKVVMTGTFSSYFNITQQPSSPINPGNSTTFLVRCIYTSVPPSIPPGWQQTGTLIFEIENSDMSQNPYDFTITLTAKN